MIFFRPVWLLLLLGLVAVGGFARAAPKEIVSQITMQRTPCDGPCPIDSLTLNLDGTASYSGVRHTARVGRYAGKIAPEQFARLATWLDEQNFFELRAEVGQDRRISTHSSDLLVHVVRDGVSYVVAFRGHQLKLRDNMENTITNAAKEIVWQKDEVSSSSGVRGMAQRALKPNEVRIFSDYKPPIISLPMQFALIKLSIFGDSPRELTTVTDAEGNFDFLVPPGRYLLSVSLAKGSRPRFDGPLWLAETDWVTVEAGKFTPVTLHFSDRRKR
jgi:hypothetical protein